MSGILWGFALVIIVVLIWLYWMWKASKGELR